MGFWCDAWVFELWCIEIHQQEITGLQLIQVVEFEQLLQVFLESFFGSLLGYVDEEGQVIAQIIGVQRVPFHKVVYDFNWVVRVV